MFKITTGWLMQNRTKKGAWTKAQFDILDLKYPPAKGWMTMCVGGGIQDKTKLAFESAAHITCKTKKPLINSDRELLNLLTNKFERKNHNHTSISALEAIRCGIGGNYGGKYYDEMIELVLQPILDYVEKHKKF